MGEDPKDEIVQVKKEEWNKVMSVITSVDGLKSDLQKERQLRIDAEAERDIEKSKNKPPVVVPPANDPATVATEAAKKVLEDREKQDIADNLKKAETLFINTHKEFHPDNDAGGIKYAAYKQKFARINLAGLKSVEDFTGAFNEALVLMNPGKSTPQRITPPGSTPSNAGASEPVVVENSQLSTKEQQLLSQMGWTEERYLKIKTSRPAYVESLLKYLS